MLLISSETIRAHRALNDVVREMSFTPGYFSSAAKLAELMGGESRRIVVLTEDHVSPETLQTLEEARDRAPFGIIVAADRKILHSSDRAELTERLAEFDNVEWVGRKFDFDTLAGSACRSRRRMLRFSRQDIKDAIDGGQFVLRYQPKVERNAGREWLTREAEALIRWNHPEHGLISPLEFLPEAEAFGMMAQLSEFVLRETARQQVTWREQGIQLNSCINLASSQLVNPDLAETYRVIVEQAGLECASFTFEVIEQDLSDPSSPHLATIEALRERGFRICLDDFRIAAASLATFEQLPFDEIKIHASALRDAQNDPVSMNVLAAVTGLAHNLGMSVCAEGVEDEATFEFLKTIECDKMQGFLISEAVIPSIIRRVYSAGDNAADEVA
ncbi:MAG: EAL domain-containing protein [Woeseiaceae bacterium]|nr:EAL domain-containing protein [Woeseiaceae bacterium]